jgi:ADP-ribosyl-[dinitrogen reductase] hydrolase
MSDMSLYDQIKGGFYGVAVGDALGGTTEFMNRKEVARTYGWLTEMIGGGVWNLEPGEVTDDTQMTLCVAEGILADPRNPVEPIGQNFLIIRAVLGSYQGDWQQSAKAVHEYTGQSAGNGSLMRCLPVALAYPNGADMERVTRLQSEMTHYDERCAEACLIYNRIAKRLLGKEALQSAIAAEAARTIYEADYTAEPDCPPSGFVVHTFRWVLHILATSPSFEAVVQKAANLGDDSDTIGAIAGGLAGIHYGFAAIPQRYSEKILIKAKLDRLSGLYLELYKKDGNLLNQSLLDS